MIDTVLHGEDLVPRCGDTSQMISPGQLAIPHRLGRDSIAQVRANHD